MLNLTLTITASPELLAAISSFTSSIAAARGNAFPVQAIQLAQPQVIDAAVDAVQVLQQGTVQQLSKPCEPLQALPLQAGALPTSTQSYTMEQLAVAATVIVDAGRRAELVSLLNSFGVQALTELPKEQYGAFATKIRGLGVNI